MSEEIKEVLAAAEDAALRAEALALYSEAVDVVAEVNTAARQSDEAMTAALDGFESVATRMQKTIESMHDADVSAHAEFFGQVSNFARVASRYTLAHFSSSAEMRPSIEAESLRIYEGTAAFRKVAEEVERAAGQGTTLSLFATVVGGFSSNLDEYLMPHIRRYRGLR